MTSASRLSTSKRSIGSFMGGFPLSWEADSDLHRGAEAADVEPVAAPLGCGRRLDAGFRSASSVGLTGVAASK